AFLDSVIHHVGRVPPSNWTLDAYGEDFPATLALRYADDPEVAEIAAIELALDRAFVGPDSPVIGVDHLAGCDWDRAVLRITPTLELIEGTTNAFELWELLSAGAMPPAAARFDTPRAMFIWRQEGISRIRIADPIEAQALRRVRAGLPFGDLCAHAAEAFGPDEGIRRTGGWLGRWIADGLEHHMTLAQPRYRAPLLAAAVALTACSAAGTSTAPTRTADANPALVVELYQSQGCSSCPPAIANVNAIADRPDVLALTFAVTYWDRLGWKDT
ncbi:hypothetical protein LTR94_026218, partial [Friedmanniomyces endolithicus]